MSDSACYSLYALRYGIGESRSACDSYIPTAGFSPPEGDFRLFCYSWVAVSAHRVVAVDGGCDEVTARARGITWERSPLDSLRVLGIAPENVDDLVLTHAHWDHAGNLTAFPNARVHVNPEELRHVTGPAMSHPYLRRPYDIEQLQVLLSLVHDGRVCFTDGDREVAPGVTVHPLGGHTPGTQVVRVSTARGPVVLASDARHFRHNNVGGDGGGAPFPIVVRVDDYCEASLRVDRLAGDEAHVIPGHDPSVARLYPAHDGDLFIHRLDVTPG